MSVQNHHLDNAAAQPSNGQPVVNNTTLPSTSSADDTLLCKWKQCSERADSAESLFDHLCERHIGRKSTNNLNLVCGWEGCNTSTVKRDHITSHVRVHVPLKPHKCGFCGKAFKRPQDLKKHVKTHAEDPVLVSTHGHPNQGSGYRHAPGKMIADLQNLAATTTGYYDPSGHMHHSGPPTGYAPPHHHAANGYYQPQQPNSYGPVYYPVNHGGDLGQSGGYDNRKRYDALNDFFGDAKRRQIDPTSYAEVGNRLTLLQGIPIQGGGMSDYMSTGPAMVSVNGHGGSAGPMAQHQYALPPMPNLRTKTDLLNIDQFLEQVQSTVYESSNSAAAAGIQQPGAHYTHTADTYRHSHSPPQNLHGLGHMASQVPSSHNTAPMRATHSSQSNSSGTPALTPASSSVSYTSGHSPTSSQGLSPTSGHRTTSAPYPSLPADANGYSPHSTAAPASTLGTNFDSDFRRRYSGGMLQRSAYPDTSSRGGLATDDDVDGSRSSTPTPTKAVNPEIVMHESSSSYPAISSVSSPSSQHSSESGDSAAARADEADQREEAWIENIRVIEALRRLIGERLERREYDEEEAEGAGDIAMSGVSEQQSQSLYPVLRADD